MAPRKTSSEIDQASRQAAASLLKEILNGKISNYEFEDKWPQKSHDPCLQAIFGEIWRYYDDYP
jgi:hypothetical protein